MFKKAKWHKAVKKAKTARKKLRDQLDHYWAVIIKQRAGNKCEHCSKVDYLNSHHIFGRSNLAVRWDLENGICLCPGHHTFNTFSAHQSPAFVDWIKEHIGIERYRRIEARSYTIRKWTIPELEELLKEFKEEIKEYE